MAADHALTEVSAACDNKAAVSMEYEVRRAPPRAKLQPLLERPLSPLRVANVRSLEDAGGNGLKFILGLAEGVALVGADVWSGLDTAADDASEKCALHKRRWIIAAVALPEDLG